MSKTNFLISLWFLMASPVLLGQTIAFFTDVEGSRTRFVEFMKGSEAFELGRDGHFHIKKNAQFVFGGDGPDRYLGSQWVIQELVRLKEEAPDRVTLIMGNRDINKMRLTSELSAAALKEAPIKFHFTKEEDWKAHLTGDTRVSRLKYIFKSTMGAPNGFELRRQEMADQAGVDVQSISEESVVDSFLDELRPGGTFRKFLEYGELAHRIGNTLFVHGGLTKENFGSVPGDMAVHASVDQWIVNLNAWLQKGVQIWEAGEGKWQGRGPREEQAWLDYPMPNPNMNSKPESVVTGRYGDRNNNPWLPAPEIIESLLAQGIQRVVIGHTPTGDYPMVLRTMDDRFELISADNSYAKSESFASLIHFKGKGLKRTEIRGQFSLDSGTVPLKTKIEIGKPTAIGKMFKGSLILGTLKDDSSKVLSFRYEDGFKIVADLFPMPNVRNCGADLAP